MNFEEMKAAMGSWLDTDLNRLPNETRGQIINICQKELLRKYDLRFAESSAIISTTNGIPGYNLPTGWSRPYSLWFLSSGQKIDINFLTKEEFDIKYPDDTSTGTPKNYTVWGDEIILGPTPNDTLSIKAFYYALLPDLTDGSPGNTNEFIANAWEVLFFRALWYATEFMVEDARGPIWERKAVMLENNLFLEHARARSSGRRPVNRDPGYVGGPAIPETA
jgi:hypothetical protein